MKLNLEAKTREQEIILEYLEKNVSEALAEKINNGIHIQKEGIELVNKKNLDGFFSYATEEARKMAEKGASSACVKDDVVYGWAIHYFEEDTIEGTLYNLDGTPYKKPTPKRDYKVEVKQSKPAKPKDSQLSFFDSLLDDEPKEEKVEEKTVVETLVNPMYQKYLDVSAEYPNHVIVTRLGDFYEAYKDDAILLSNELNLTLTSRQIVGIKERVPMIGFPYHCAELYFNRIKKTNKLAIIENEQVIADNDEDEEDDEIEELSVDEMKAFDGDIEEDYGECNVDEPKDEIIALLYELFDENVLFGGI